MKPLDDIFVVGTDTGVGKSVVSLLLMRLLYDRGYLPFYLKPFQTGCDGPQDPDSDAAFVYGHTSELRGRDPSPSVIHCHPNPKAPFFAARDVGQSVEPEEVTRAIAGLRNTYSPIVVEGAGGLLVPVTADLLVADIISMTDCRPILVARSGLGTINHTLLSIETLKRREIDLLGVVFVESGGPQVDPRLVVENMEAVEKFGDATVGGVIPTLDDFSTPPVEALRPLERILF